MQQGLLMGEDLAGCRSTAGKSGHSSCDTPLDVGSCPSKTHFTGISRVLGNLIIIGSNKAAALDGDLMETLTPARGCLFLLPVPDLVLNGFCYGSYGLL